MPSSPQRGFDLPENNPFSSEGEASVLESAAHPAHVTSLTGDGCESGGKPIKDFDVVPRHDILHEFSDQGTSAGREATHMKEMIPDNRSKLQRPVAVSTELLSEVKEPPDASIKKGFLDGKYAPNEGISVKQGKLEEQNLERKHSDANAKVDSAHLWSNRSKWDLNTTMDKWEDSSNDLALNHGTRVHARLNLASMPNRQLESGPTQISYHEPSGSNETRVNCKLQKFENHLRMSTLPKPNAADCSNSESCLDLQLKPSFTSSSCFQSGKLFDSLRDRSFLSLSMQPTRAVSNPKSAAGITVKPEPSEGSQKDSMKVEMDRLASPGRKYVKSEPCEGQEALKMTTPADMISALSVINRAVKSEPLDDQSQVYLRSLEGPSSPSMTPHSTETQDSGKHENKVSDLASVSLVSDACMQQTIAEEPKTNVPSDSNEMAGKALNLDTQVDNIPIKSSTPQDRREILCKPSCLTLNSLTSESMEMDSVKKACETDRLPSVLPPATLVSDDREITVQMDSSDGCYLSEVTSIHEVTINACGNVDVSEDDVGKRKVDTTGENLEQPHGAGNKADGSSVAVGVIGTLRRLCGNEDDYEDGEVRDPTLIGAVKGSPKKREEKQVKEADSIGPVDIPVAMPSDVDAKQHKIEKLEELNDQGSILDGHYDKKDNPNSSTVAGPIADPGKRKPSKTIRKTPRDHFKKGKESEGERNSEGDLTEETIAEGCPGSAGSQKVNAGVSDLHAKVSVSSKKDSSEMDAGTENANARESHRRIVYLNAPSRLTSGKMKSTLGRSMSSRIEKNKPTNTSFRRDRSLSRSSRDENGNERPRKPDCEGSHDHPGGKRGSDFMRVRGRADDRMNALHVERNSDPHRLLERMNNSSRVHRFPRHVKASEVAVTAASDRSGRLARKPTNGELQDLSRIPFRRRSPMGRGQMPMMRHPVRDISPSRCIGRDVPDFMLLAHEEKLMRALPDGVMDAARPAHSRSQYDQEREGILVRRERRSLSPVRWRGPVDLSHIGSKSFPRSGSPHQWSPPRRTSDGFTGPPTELVRCRSPPIGRLNRIRSPHQRPCFPEDMIVRRRGSPPFIARLPNDEVDIGSLREHDFPRPVRGPHRNVRRFDLINPQEMAEGEFFGPPMHRAPIHEFPLNDEFIEDRRRSDERRRSVRSSRLDDIAGDTYGEGFRFHVEDGPPRPLRFCPEANGGGSPRNFDGHVRNRLGGRLRGMEEQEDNYRHQGEQGWHDASFSDVRLKRRRF